MRGAHRLDFNIEMRKEREEKYGDSLPDHYAPIVVVVVVCCLAWWDGKGNSSGLYFFRRARLNYPEQLGSEREFILP